MLFAVFGRDPSICSIRIFAVGLHVLMEMTLALLIFVTGSLESMIRVLANITGARHRAKWLRDASMLWVLGSSVLLGDLGWFVCRF